MKIKIINRKAFLIIITFTLLLSSCSNNKNELEQLKSPKLGEEIAIMETNFGTIKIRLFPEIAPKAVENFKTLADEEYYNNKTFFRVREDDFIMAVDSTEEDGYLNSIWGEPFEDEFNPEYCHFRGAVSIANRGPDTNESSFFIVKRDYIDNEVIKIMRELGEDESFQDKVVDSYERLGGLYELDFKHTVFGQVFYGIETVDKISKVSVDCDFQPFEPVIIEKIEIVPYEGK